MPRPLPLAQPTALGPAPEPPIFERIAIVGLGLIGGSVALACRKRWPRIFLIGVDHKSVLEQAMLMNAVDVAADELYITSEAELVILAAPIAQNIARLQELAEHTEGEAIVTDTGSTKRSIVDAARHLPSRLAFVGGHPLAGAARSGIEHARADLFEARPWVFTPEGAHESDALTKLKAFVAALGALPRLMPPGVHDRALAYISHVPQLTASVLMHVIGSEVGAEGLELSGRGLRDTTRLASSPVGIWTDICQTNRDEIEPALDALIEALQEVRGNLRSAAVLDKLFASANRWRTELSRKDGIMTAPGKTTQPVPTAGEQPDE